ncbi:ATP-dependent DNA helicase [Candidatus Mycoplasma mahonii]|uniref:ATP-dependent DNA helicase n=1 Tax=Candidatus Mycoplasma mahonii TaxID=3004105 RepID=UPI0026EDE8D5|nr:ATP-dependent RecD-like DNA helicase [Candidatus Mycoplasma mahonii]WKX02285.1 ATP-dependent RecD-like DNA helicase [Candidatus Mycoplasma mahonii]
MTPKEIYKLVDEWLVRIHQDKLYLDLNDETIKADNSIDVTAYNFLKRAGVMVFVEVNHQLYYIKIYNKTFLKYIENPNDAETYYVTKNISKVHKAIRLGKSIKFKNIEPLDKAKMTDLFGHTHAVKIKPKQTKKIVKKQHVNDVWSIKTKDEMFAIGNINELDTFQKNAYDNALNLSELIITGFAGSGKSHLIKHISNQLKAEGWNVSRIAPTGKASQVILGKTIHSWLEPIIKEITPWKYEILGFKRSQVQAKECLIIDESSMIDDELWGELQRVWNNSIKITDKKMIFVGDPAQLEPVGEGKPFIEAILDKKMSYFPLKQIHRTQKTDILSIQDMGQFVRKNGHLDPRNEYQGISYISKDEAFNKIIKDNSHIMITPRRNYHNGTIEINNIIKERFALKLHTESFYTQVWSDEMEAFVNKTPVHLNDKIIVIKNMWHWNITNGTTGLFLGEEKVRIYDHINKTFAPFKSCYKFISQDTQSIFYLPTNKFTRAAIELAYAITIHKSQGSEYNNVILYLPTGKVSKKMLYTAVTRAKKHLYIVK